MQSKREEWAENLRLANALKKRRAGRSQREMAAIHGIPYGTYVQAETYGRMGPRVRERVKEILKGKTK